MAIRRGGGRVAQPTEEELINQVKTLAAQLHKNAKQCRLLKSYYRGNAPVPKAIKTAKVTKAYRLLMPMAEAPWGSLPVNAIAHRLEPTGVRDKKGHEEAADHAWGIWQDNQLDSEFRLALRPILYAGRAYGTAWPDEEDEIEISFDTPEQMVIQYEEGSTRRRKAALRLFIPSDGKTCATLYRADGIYKFESKTKRSNGGAGTTWVKRTVEGEDWPLENPLKKVPVVELAVNRELEPGEWGYARGDFEHCLGLLERIHLLTFLGLVVAFYMGFPLRGVKGEEITYRVLKDDDGNPILDDQGEEQDDIENPEPPFDAHAGGVAQLESKDAEIWEFKAADRSNLSIYDELDQFSAITFTPRHYFPLKNGMSNIGADTIRANEGGHFRKGKEHEVFIGEGIEELLRLAVDLDQLGEDEPLELSQRAEIDWRDLETRSLAERADAAAKLGALPQLPWVAVAEMALNASQDTINRWAAQSSGDAFGKLLTEVAQPSPPATEPAPEPEPEPVA